MKSKRQLKLITYFLILIIITVIGIISYYLISAGINSYIIKEVSYKEKSDIDYKVYLFDNNFFDAPYIEKGKTYISSLIDYIDIEMKYNLNFSELVSGKYIYYVNGTILANKPNSNNDTYWNKTYTLVEPQIVEYDSNKGFDFITNIKVDYQKYNNILKEFKSEYGLAFDGLLKIELNVQSTNETTIMSNPIKINSIAQLSIPLTQQIINLSIDLSNINEENRVFEKEQHIDLRDKIFITTGSILLMLYIITLFIWFQKIKKYLKSQSVYNKTRRKILKTYNSIIVNTENVPLFDTKNIINVSDFTELIDAQSEVRMPINYIEIKANKESIFILIGNNVVWIYTLIDEEYKMKKQKNKHTSSNGEHHEKNK